MTISNYSDDARSYLKRLITLMGGEFTPEMNLQNTIVIAAFISGKKTEKAREWSIPIVNHTWLEDCFVAWKDITPAQEKYIRFPEGFSFAQIVAERGVGRIGFDVASEQEIAAIQADIEEEKERREKERAKEEENVKETKGEVGALTRRGTGASQKEAMEVEVVVGLLDFDDEGAPMVEDVWEGEQQEQEQEPQRSPTPTPPVAPSKKRGKSSKAATKKLLVSEDEDEESQPRQIPQTNGRKKGALESKGQSSRSGGSTKATRAAQGETDVESDEEHAKSPKAKTNGKPSKTTAKARVRAPSVSEDDEVQEVVEKSTPRLTRSQTAQSPSRGKSNSPSKASRVDSDEVIHVDSDDDETYSTRRRTRSATSSPAKSSQGAPIPAKVSTTSFYAPSPKKPAVAQKAGSKKTGSTSRIDDMMQDLSSDSDGGGSGALSPLQAANKEKSRPSVKKAAPAPARAQTDDEGFQKGGDRIGPPRRGAKIKKGPAAASTPKKALPRRELEEDEEEDDSFLAPGPSSKLVVEVEIESQSRPVAGPSRVAAAASEMTASPSRARPSKKRARSPSPTPPPPAAAKRKNTKEKKKSVTPSSVDEPEQNGNGGDISSTVTTSGRQPGRQAKALATQKLKDDFADANQFQKEMKNGRVRGAWEKDLKGKGKAPPGTASPAGVKRRASAVSSSGKDGEDVGKEEEDEEKPGKKKRKVGEGPSKVAEPKGKKKARFNGPEADGNDEPTSQQSKRSEDGLPGKGIKFMTTVVNLDVKTVEGLIKLGMKPTEKPTECTHLMCRGITRTEKFLLALANGPFVLTKEWAVDCVKKKQVLPPEDYELYDTDGEAKHGMKLKETLERARFQRGKLFMGHTFHLTSGVPNYGTVKSVITTHGGKLDSKKKPTKAWVEGGKESRHVISCAEDKSVWRELAAEGFPVYSSEVIMGGVLRHDVDWTDKKMQIGL